jgi:hypothetical protein
MRIPDAPTDFLENLKWREECSLRFNSDMQYQVQVILRCKNDPVFFFHTMLRTKNPKGMWNPATNEMMHGGIPFILFPKQREWVAMVGAALMDKTKRGRFVVPKSREQGITWMLGGLAVWLMLFHTRVNTTVASLKLSDLDGKDTSFLGQTDYMMEWISKEFPVVAPWLSGIMRTKELTRRQKYRKNPVTASEITTSTATQNFARGDRLLLGVIDEAVAIETKYNEMLEKMISSGASACHVLVVASTLDMAGGHFDELRHNEDWVCTQLHWTDNPFCRKDFYICEAGKCHVHRDGGMPHSAWYDEECRARSYNAARIGSELDIKPIMAGGNVFDIEGVSSVIHRIVNQPAKKFYDTCTVNWKGRAPSPRESDDNDWFELDVLVKEDPYGRFKIAKHPEVGHRYGVGVDCATGVNDDSCVYVIDMDGPNGWEAVAEWCEKAGPQETADACAMLGKYYEKHSDMEEMVPIGVERNGQGVAVVSAVKTYGARVPRCVVTVKGSKKEFRDGIIVHSGNKVATISNMLCPLINNKNPEDGLPVLTVPFLDFWRECRQFIIKKVGQSVTMQGVGKRPDNRVMAMLHACSMVVRFFGWENSRIPAHHAIEEVAEDAG